MTQRTRGRRSFNPKRRIRATCDTNLLAELEKKVKYGGNPEHKRNPGDFKLTPPAQPRSDKTLCDHAGVVKRSLARGLLKMGVKRGLISEQTSGEFPQNVWSVTDDGCPMEAQLENRKQGIYHGYPMPQSDPLRREVLRRWNHK